VINFVQIDEAFMDEAASSVDKLDGLFEGSFNEIIVSQI